MNKWREQNSAGGLPARVWFTWLSARSAGKTRKGDRLWE